LDKGELDKILDYAARKYDAAKIDPQRRHNDYNDDSKYNDKYNKPHRRKSLLGDLFDFD